MPAFPFKTSDSSLENVKPADPIRAFVLNPANELALKDALQVISTGRIKNVVNAYGAYTILNPNEVRELFDK